ncbi:MAG: glycoside hydrolase [Terriglobia bacterium]
MSTTYLMLLWHMHQPYYKDLVEDSYAMPWVRLHAWKDYYGMVAMLKDFPDLHMTFNLVPSLVAQIQDYANDQARESFYDVAFKPAESLTPQDQATLLASAFQINRENLLWRYPRFRELFDRFGSGGNAARGRPAVLMQQQDIRDLQVLSQLAWFDELYLAGDRDVKRLVGKQRGYAEEDKAVLRGKGIKLFQAVLKEYGKASARGQIEISTSPFYHPILPLLCDTDVAAESRSGVRLPSRRFRHPEDARDQLRAAIALHTHVFGTRPVGLWPSEGSVSDELLALAAEEGFRWAATDEGVLARSLQTGFHRQADGSVWGADHLYRPQRLVTGGREISLFFRDHELSDLIGFVYSRMDPEAAAVDLHHRIRAVAQSRANAGNDPAVVSIILDGENCWEFYPGNGRDFLRRFYARLAADPELRAVTASEALELATPGTLRHLVPGSWINSNFDVWIGAEEDNRAWDLLADARDFFALNCARPGLDPAKVEAARHELWIAEGSDWCWWYGPEHSTPNDAEFDRLYRTHLSNVYRLLGGSPPDQLATPIKHAAARAVSVPPSAPIRPRIDGRVTDYFEWMGAGFYSPDSRSGRSGTMHGAAQVFEALYYGSNNDSGGPALSLRFDLSENFRAERPDFEVRVNLDGEIRLRFQARVVGGKLSHTSLWKGDEPVAVVPGHEAVKVAYDRVFEMQLDYKLLQLDPHAKASLQVSLWVDALPVQVVPEEGWITLEATDDLVGW